MTRRPAIAIAFVCMTCALPGCVERRIVITSEPTGATVFLNDTEVGRTPVEVDFTYFGVYDVRVRKDGFEPLATTAEAKAPFYEWPGVDLVAMLVPVTKKTRIDWHFDLQPANADESSLLERASAARASFTAEQSSSGQ
ncbi:MAG: PEGA domain-containing protein [Phycisphaerales bacterium]|nr:PEGA domain-containing protein [Phycisphaerales bacterium]